jgi:hypothetical protein
VRLPGVEEHKNKTLNLIARRPFAGMCVARLTVGEGLRLRQGQA